MAATGSYSPKASACPSIISLVSETLVSLSIVQFVFSTNLRFPDRHSFETLDQGGELVSGLFPAYWLSSRVGIISANSDFEVSFGINVLFYRTSHINWYSFLHTCRWRWLRNATGFFVFADLFWKEVRRSFNFDRDNCWARWD